MLSETQPIYAVGDIHGQIDKLLDVIERINIDASASDTPPQVVFVGDLVDRGHHSKAVIEMLISAIKAGHNYTVLKGNHDRMFQLFLEDYRQRDPILNDNYTWLHPRLGGSYTLYSYGIKLPHLRHPRSLFKAARRKVPREHRRFIAKLPFFVETENYYFVHAGVNPALPLSEQREDDLLWIRDPFLEFSGQLEKMVIHGHTPVDAPTHYGNRINIDTGAAFGGPLTVLVLDQGQAHHLTPSGRMPLTRA